ncbi:MAG: hypothetical protein V1738_01120 [Patescibacteria group bacterium]
MDNQTNYPNDGENSEPDRPLTSFLQSRQFVRTENTAADKKSDMPSWQKPLNENQVGNDDQTDSIDHYADSAADNHFPQFGDILSDDMPLDGENVRYDHVPSPELESSIEHTTVEPGTLTRDFDGNKLNVALKALRQMEQQIATVISLLEGGSTMAAQEQLSNLSSALPFGTAGSASATHEDLATLKPIDGRVVEGVFDGRGMVGSDGKSYLVPPNYASKSKLVEGDMLKLTITPKGSFIYKQIGPIERSRLIGSLGYDQTIGEYYATSENRRWNVLKASVTYFKGEPGDEVVLLVPKNAPSKWAAVENIIKKNPLG